MTFRNWHYTAVCGLSLVLMQAAAAQAPRVQTPRYQSPLANGPQPNKVNLPASTAITPNGEVVEEVVVRVNDQIINRSDVQRSQDQLTQELQQTNASPTEAADRQKNMLRDMIDQQLLLSRGKELGLNVDAEVIRRLDDIRKQNKLESMEDLEKAARQQGVSYEDFKANIRNGIITQQVVRDEVGRRLQMTQAQEQAFYAAHQQEFIQPEQVRLSEILVPTAADANDAAIAQAQAKAGEVEDKLKAGGKFEELAKTYSGGPTAAQGGDLGQPYKRGALAKVIEDQTFGLKVGEFTVPIRTRQGFVILKVTEHTTAAAPPLKEVEPQVQEAMYMDQMQPALRAYLTKLREDAYVEIKPGYVDTGASTKQTKPVFTAYAPPAVKAKKVVQKQRFDRGGRFSTVSKGQAAVSAPVAAPPTPVVPDSTAAATPPTAVASSSAPAQPAPKVQTGAQLATLTKSKKVKREKIRFGQAPRTSLPTGTQMAGLAADDGLGSNHEQAAKPGEVAPGTVIAPLDTSTSNIAEANPLTPVAAPQSKTRFSARAKTEAATKAAKKTAKVKEKAASASAPMTAEEKASAQTQAAPLGLAGDTGKKPKKVKVKGAPKERLQQQAPQPKAPLPPETAAKAPSRGTPLEGTASEGKPKPSADETALPAVTTPGSATPESTATPATPGHPIPIPPPQ